MAAAEQKREQERREHERQQQEIQRIILAQAACQPLCDSFSNAIENEESSGYDPVGRFFSAFISGLLAIRVSNADVVAGPQILTTLVFWMPQL